MTEVERALARVADVMTVARRPWWVIGSAAVRLHGAETDVHDIDVLIVPEDADAVSERIGTPLPSGAPGELFRSARFGRWTPDGMTIEFMAALEVRTAADWCPVTLATRAPISGVFVPERAELAALLRRFGREKDLRRAAAVDALG